MIAESSFGIWTFLIGVVAFWGCLDGWFEGIYDRWSEKNDRKKTDQKRNEILISIQNLHGKIDDMERDSKNWQMPILLASAWPLWVRHYDIDNSPDDEIRQAAEAVRQRFTGLTKRVDAIPLEMRRAFQEKNMKLSFNAERWEVKGAQLYEAGNSDSNAR